MSDIDERNPNDLTPEEQALAARLAQLQPRGEPGPALDARILAAARTAATGAADPSRRGAIPAAHPRPRWPVALGVAASLLLAVGLAWRLRPLPGPIPDFDAGTGAAQAPVAAAPPAPTDAEMSKATSSPAARAPAESKSPASTGAAAPAAPVPAPVRADVPQPSGAPPPPAPPAPPREQTRAFDRPVSAPAPAVSAPAIAPPESSTSIQSSARSASTASKPMASDAVAAQSAADRANAASPSLPETETLGRLEAGAARGNVAEQSTASDEPGDDVPPATMASPQARDAWLARIRELMAHGRDDAARDSLQEFVRRYPAFVLPADLQALAQ